MRYVLEVQGFVDWEVERDFRTVELAQIYGRERFAQNVWRIVDRLSQNEVVHLHDPTTVFEESASNDIRRFASTDRWMAQRFAPQRIPQRQRMGQIAARQANLQPYTLEGVAQGSQYYQRLNYADIQRLAAKKKDKRESVNWKVEGF